MKKLNTKAVVLAGILIAIKIVAGKWLSIPTPMATVSLSFIPIAIVGSLYPPIWAGLIGVIADVVGATLFPHGPFFFGYTISAFLNTFIWSLFLYDREITWKRITAAAVITSVFVSFGLGTVWVHMMRGYSYLALIPTRATTNSIILAAKIVVLPLILPSLVKAGRKYLNEQR